MGRSASLAPVTVTLAEYQARLAQSAQRLELCDGLVIDMAGGTFAHNDLAVNLTVALSAALSGRPCRVNGSDVLVGRADAEFRAFPDLTITCGDRQALPGEPNTIANPMVIVEVTSASTEAFDRGKKFAHYRRIPALCEYVIVSHLAAQIDVYTRAADDSWVLREYGTAQIAELVSIDAQVAVDDIYRGIVLEL
jgi:Uma2 family endonuclease